MGKADAKAFVDVIAYATTETRFFGACIACASTGTRRFRHAASSVATNGSRPFLARSG